MRKLLTTITTLAITLTPLPTHSAPLPPVDLSCYMVIGGRVINLEGIGGDCGERKSDGTVTEVVKPKQSPLAVENIVMNRIGTTNFARVSATIRNRGKEVAEISTIQYVVKTSQNGTVVSSGTIPMLLSEKTLDPGESTQISGQVALGGWIEITAKLK